MSENGTEYTRTEVVKSQPVIDAYVRLMGHGTDMEWCVLQLIPPALFLPSRRERGSHPVCGSGPADPRRYEEGEEEDPGPAATPQEAGGEGYQEETEAAETKATHHHQCENGVARGDDITTRVKPC